MHSHTSMRCMPSPLAHAHLGSKSPASLGASTDPAGQQPGEVLRVVLSLSSTNVNL